MLNETDAGWLMEQLVATAEILGQPISQNALAMMATDLGRYPRKILAAALQRVRKTHAGRLTPKAIIEAIDAVMGRSDANEAWAIAVAASDERATVAWTIEIAKAWEIARPVMQGGDEIGARMAFKGAYERFVQDARENGRMPVPFISEGWNAVERAPGIEKAISSGHIGHDAAAAYLPPPKATIDPKTMLTGKFGPGCTAKLKEREKLILLRNVLAEKEAQSAKLRAENEASAVADLIARKQRAQDLTDEYTAQDEAAKLRQAEWAALNKSPPSEGMAA